ncbi:MAG: hypothetical protein HDS72_04600 [Bacteroidales bacterium]|nr:hypothetical protein [Bacteroidales bacterium]
MSSEIEESIQSDSAMVNNTPIRTSNSDTEISQNPKENTRKIIASLYVWAFFIIIYLTLIIGILNNYTVDDYKDILIAISGILSGPLGFIVGYYFKASNE